jgi:hypothetical protein
MLERGDLVPHFDVTTLEGDVVNYSTIWQQRILVLVTLPASESDASSFYVSQLTAHRPAFSQDDLECVITQDCVTGVPTPGVLVADRWGEIIHMVAASDVTGLPPPAELLDWVEYVRRQCPECQGEAK